MNEFISGCVEHYLNDKTAAISILRSSKFCYVKLIPQAKIVNNSTKNDLCIKNLK